MKQGNILPLYYYYFKTFLRYIKKRKTLWGKLLKKRKCVCIKKSCISFQSSNLFYTKQGFEPLYYFPSTDKRRHKTLRNCWKHFFKKAACCASIYLHFYVLILYVLYLLCCAHILANCSCFSGKENRVCRTIRISNRRTF